MAGRNRMPRHPVDIHGLRGGPRPVLSRGPLPLPVHPLALEEELEIQHRENRKIVAENRHLLDENVNLERDLVSAKDEIHRLDEFIAKLRADNIVKYRDLIERNLKLEADLRATEPLREELLHLRSETQKLNVMKQDLTGQVQGLTANIARLRSENKQLYALRVDVDGIHKELAEARRALEYEKKANDEQVQQKDAMEKNLMSMAREIEKLRTEQMSMDRRGHGLGGSSSYSLYNGVPDMRYPSGGAPAEGHGGAWGPYSKRPRH
ncbi:protein FLX-like 3 isoform X1 [Amaranthus tricolor]|uniref:protein FLX-like 3 isoform X1 n=1 Tax=Amaranthus tricolor TaxID=29722 RepID=UPI00258E9F4A|nr:protein FLX-like 3 isoform X1 [Amaranthus tricolor]XP_057543164.1 protein FLX-like 3 isoform X1 [Amaranthus tricolor]